MRFCNRCGSMMEQSDPDTKIFPSLEQLRAAAHGKTEDEYQAALAELRTANACRWEEFITFECRQCDVTQTIKTADHEHPYGYDH